jgi:plastocyanin
MRGRVGTWVLAIVATGWIVACGQAPQEASPEMAMAEPTVDSMPPMMCPEHPQGAWGFSHYVFSRVGGNVVPTLVEGPRGEQVRCQSEELPCSYLDLKNLYDSGAPIPEALRMSREELGELVSELDKLSKHLASYTSIDRACAEGYRREGTQNRNMGIHMMNNAYRTDGVFDIMKPEMLLFGMEGGEILTQEQLGDCVDGRWTGDPKQEIVGAAFILPTDDFGDGHVAGFAGPLDNWHTHYHTCLGTNSTAILTREECEANGGTYIEKYGWMIHVYAVPTFDNQAGVFAMWNSAIWPRAEASAMARPAEEVIGRESMIFDFKFESVEVEPGDTVTFRNADHFFHSVKAGTPTAPAESFDSGDLYADETFSVKFDEAGEYDFFCEIHPFMTGKVVVK